MPDKEFDPWEFSSGLVDSYSGTVTDAYFGFDPQYMDGKRCVLKLEIQTDDPTIGEGGVATELYPAGEGWEPANKGAKLVREDGNAKPLNVNSGVALLVTSIVDAGGGAAIKGKGTPFDADIYKGVSGEWHREQFEFKTNDGKTQGYSRMLLKTFDTKATPTAPAKSTPAAEAPSAEDGGRATVTSNGGSTSDALDAKLKAKLKVLAKTIKGEGGDHDVFVERAFTDVEGVMDNQAAEDAVMDTSDAGLFANA